MSSKSPEEQLNDCGIELPVGLIVGQEVRSFELDKNRINCYGNKVTRLGDKCYPRTQFSQKGFENEQLYVIFNTPLKGDRARKGEDGPLDVDADPYWFNTQTIGVKMDPDHENNSDMYKVGISVGEFMRSDIFRREYGQKKYTDTKPGDKGVIMYDATGNIPNEDSQMLVIPRNQTFSVIVRHWNVDTKQKNKANGVHLEVYVDPSNNMKWQRYLDIDDIGQVGGGNPIINPKFNQRVQTRLDEAKPHWSDNIIYSEIRPITISTGKDFISWSPNTNP